VSDVEVIRAAALDGIAHGFLGRRGGVSTGAYAGLNVGVGSDDDPNAIIANRALATDAVVPGATLATLYQTHSADALVVRKPIIRPLRPQGDALVTDRPGIALGILTADCAPVLLADREAGVVAAAHAGWKGAIGGVTDSAIATMESLGARRNRIHAAIGPCIARASYEVDTAFARRFEAADPANERFFTPGRAGHHQFDLEAYVAARLATAGITRIEALGEDTYTQADRFYSYRRAIHRGEPGYGRQVSIVGLEA
jgi:YfiH family protein